MFQGMQVSSYFFIMCLTGPSGYTIREVIKQTEADVKSWTDKLEDESMRPTRTFIIEVRSLEFSEGIFFFIIKIRPINSAASSGLWLSVEE